MTGALLIVGAGPGIGQATAERFGREGFAVVLASRGAGRLAPLVAALRAKGIEAHAMPFDATDAAAVAAGVAEADRIAGGLTAVLYNAAVVRRQDLLSMTDAEVEADIAADITGGVHVVRAAARLFEGRGGSGTILVTGGGLAVAPDAGFATLGLGKAALRNLVEGLAPDFARRGIRIATATVATLVAPGSAEAEGVADTFWRLAAEPDGLWEARYPAPSAPLTLVARLTARPEHAETVGAALRALVAPTLREAGALGYVVHRDDDDPNVWILYETWRTRADLKTHFTMPHTKALTSRFPELLARPMELTHCSIVPPAAAIATATA